MSSLLPNSHQSCALPQDKAAIFRNGLFGAVALLFLLCGVMLATTLAANEMSKESHVAGSALVGTDGVTVETGAFKNYATLYDLPKFDVKTIMETKQVTLMLENNQELAFTITGAMKRTGSLQATFLTPGGTITVDSVTRTASACVNGKRYKSAAPAVGEKSQRRLLLERAPRLYAHDEFFGIALAHEHGRGRSLGVKDTTNEGWASMAVALKDALTDKVDSKDMVSGSASASSGGVEMSVMYAFNAKKVLDDDTSCGNSAPIGGVGFPQKVPFTYKNAPGEFSMLMTTHDTVEGSLEEHLNATSHQWSVYVDNLRSKEYARRLHASRCVYPMLCGLARLLPVCLAPTMLCLPHAPEARGPKALVVFDHLRFKQASWSLTSYLPPVPYTSCPSLRPPYSPLY